MNLDKRLNELGIFRVILRKKNSYEWEVRAAKKGRVVRKYGTIQRALEMLIDEFSPPKVTP